MAGADNQLTLPIPDHAHERVLAAREERRAEMISDLDDLRRRRGLTHRRLAGLSGLAPSTVRTALQDRANPELSTLLAVAEGLGLQLRLAPGGTAASGRGQTSITRRRSDGAP